MKARSVLLWLMAAFYAVAGVMHFLSPGFYRPMMPPYLPAHETLIALSGAAELLLGLALLAPGLRPWAAWGIILLLLAVFPANMHIALHDIPIGGAAHGLGALNWIRMPIQGLLILWAWWYTGETAAA
jgi:uncharacterized membrane protein